MKNSERSAPKTKITEEEDFELVLEAEKSSDCEFKSSKTEISEDENSDGESNLEKLKSKPVIKKAKLLPKTKGSSFSKPKTEFLSNRPKLPACKNFKFLYLIG